MKINLTKIFGLLFFLTPFFLSCKKTATDIPKDALLEVNGKILSRSELPPAQNLTPADSAILHEIYIKRWITDVLMYENARKNVKNIDEINRLVEDYRRILTVQHYQQMLISQRLNSPKQEEIDTFYTKNSSQYILNEAIIKGIFVKIPLNTKKIKDLKKWLEEKNEENLEKIEKFSVKNFGALDYFQDKWIYLSQVLKLMPPMSLSEKAIIAQNSLVEAQDSAYLYLLKISESRVSGDEAPIEFATEMIKNVLLNQKKIELIQSVEEEMFKNAKVNYFKNE